MQICIVITAILALAQSFSLSEVEEQQWNEFTLTYKKQYENGNEESKRKEIFAQNLQKFEEHNKKYAAGLVSYKLGVNQFTDMTPEDFSKTLIPMNVSALTGGRPFVIQPNAEVPDSIDWREKGAVTPVKKQKYAGESYAYSAIGALEGHFAINGGELKSLSEQNIIDCIHSFPSHSCYYHGLPSDAFEYVGGNGGIAVASQYPVLVKPDRYTCVCKYSTKISAGTSSGYVTLARYNEQMLLKAVATKGPVSIVLNAVGLIYYDGGVFDGDCQPWRINHAALIVGYNTTSDGQDYWIVKNSWGEYYGEGGYIRIARNQNMCGLATLSTYPIVP